MAVYTVIGGIFCPRRCLRHDVPIPTALGASRHVGPRHNSGLFAALKGVRPVFCGHGLVVPFLVVWSDALGWYACTVGYQCESEDIHVARTRFFEHLGARVRG